MPTLQKESEGQALEAMALLEVCRVENCWEQVYVAYREMQDRYVQSRVAKIEEEFSKTTSLQPNEAMLLIEGFLAELSMLEEQYAHSDELDVVQKTKISYEKELESLRAAP